MDLWMAKGSVATGLNFHAKRVEDVLKGLHDQEGLSLILGFTDGYAREGERAVRIFGIGSGVKDPASAIARANQRSSVVAHDKEHP